MKIKRYFGNTNQEAMQKLKKELGPEAVILNTRKIKKPGLFGFLKKPIVEVVAAVDDYKGNATSKDFLGSGREDIIRTETRKMKSEKIEKKINTPRESTSKNVYQNTKKEQIKPLNMNTNSAFKAFDFGNKENETSAELKKMRETMEIMMNTMSLQGGSANAVHPLLRKYHQKFLENGVEDLVSVSILKEIGEKVNIENKDESEIEEIVKYSLMEYLGEPEPINNNENQKIIFFIGPTGVGKTTTLAKIAAQYAIKNNKSVGLITSDTYRIAAVEQLRTYSDILDIPLKIIYDTKEMYSALSKFKDKRILLIDTAGRSHKNEKEMEEIKEIMETVKNKEAYLVLSATTNFSTIKSTIEKYNFTENYKLIFTKVDEAENIGAILNTKFYYDYPLSYIATGQNVPEDIKVADVSQLSKLLIGEI